MGCTADRVVDTVPEARVAPFVACRASAAPFQLRGGIEVPRPQRGRFCEAAGANERDAGDKNTEGAELRLPLHERDQRERHIEADDPAEHPVRDVPAWIAAKRSGREQTKRREG